MDFEIRYTSTNNNRKRETYPYWISYTATFNITHTTAHTPANDHELLDRRLLADVAVDVHSEERAGAVEDGRQVAHQRSQHHRQH